MPEIRKCWLLASATLKKTSPRRTPVPQTKKLRLGEFAGWKTVESRRERWRFLILFIPPTRRPDPNSRYNLPGPFLESGFREPASPVPPRWEQRPPPSRRFLPLPRPARYLRRPCRQAPSSRAPAGAAPAVVCPHRHLGRGAGRQEVSGARGLGCQLQRRAGRNRLPPATG